MKMDYIDFKRITYLVYKSMYEKSCLKDWIHENIKHTSSEQFPNPNKMSDYIHHN